MSNIRDISFINSHYIAHRGLHNDKIIENTIPAFKEAINKNYPIELDVHLLKDNEIVVFHDNNLKRLLNINKDIKDYTYKELSKLKINNKYHIPTLREVLDLVDGKVPIIIELKYDNKVGLLEKELVKLLDNYKGKFSVQSFNPFIVRWFKKNRKNYIRGLLISSKKRLRVRFSRSKIALLITKPDYLAISKKLPTKKISKYHKYPIIIWTINNKKVFDKFKDKYNLVLENINEFIN